jgi:hypothetical protein
MLYSGDKVATGMAMHKKVLCAVSTPVEGVLASHLEAENILCLLASLNG